MLRRCWLGLMALVAFAFVALAPQRAAAQGTDANGFITEWLTLVGYVSDPAVPTDGTDAEVGPGSDPGAALRGSDYLCDGVLSEDSIVPEQGLQVFPPVADPEDCTGSKTPALSTFHPLALTDGDGALPITSELAAGDTIDFDAISGGMNNAMAYAWVYVENVTDSSLNVECAIASDDSIVVSVNRAEVFNLGVGRGFGAAGVIQNTFPVTLSPGGNLIQVKVFDGCCGWGFRLRFQDENCEPLLSGDGQIEVGTTPVEIFDPPGSRSITGVAGGADVTVSVDNGGASYDLTETFDNGFMPSGMSPAATDSGPGFVTWTGITAGEVSYTVTRDDAFATSEAGIVGTLTLNGIDSTVTGDSQIPGGVPPYVPEVLVTPSLDLPFDDGMGNAVQGCNIPPDMIEGDWVADGAGLTDQNIVPEEGMMIAFDFEGASLATGLSAVSVDAEDRFWTVPGDPLGSGGILNRVTSADGFYDWQRGDIYGVDVDQTGNVAFFYAINPTDDVMDVNIGFGSDDAGGVRLNGFPVHTAAVCRGNPGFADKFRVPLDPGKNLISVYTFEDGGGYNMAIRFEDEEFNPISIETTLDPTGYDPADHDPPEDVGKFFIDEVLVTPSYDMQNFNGCNLTEDAINGNWIAGVDGNGDPVTDADIVPQAGMVLAPDFGGDAPNTAGLNANIAAAAQDRFWTDPGNAGGSDSILRPENPNAGWFNWQRGDIYAADVDVTMNAAFFYVMNETGSPMCVNMGAGSDDAIGVRVNGMPVWANPACRGDPGYVDKFPAYLDPGKNLITVYTYENGGGYNMRIRFEDEVGNPIALPTTIDPTGYDPADHAPPPMDCTPQPPDPEPYLREGPGAGFVTEFLVPALPLDHGLGASTIADAFPEDYISFDGDPGNIDNVFEGAIASAGVSGLITTAVRGSNCGFTTLVKYSSFEDGNPADPGDFNGEAFYGNPDNYSSSLFYFVENLTDEDIEAWMGFASDDGASLFVNGNLIAEFLAGRGRGGANVIQTFATVPAVLEPGPNLVQISYTEGGGGSGARVAMFRSRCFDEVLGEDEVSVSANPPGFDPSARITASRSLEGFDCEGNASATITFSGSGDVELLEELPDGVTGSNPSQGSFNGAGTVLSFSGAVNDGDTITYDISGATAGGTFCFSTANGSPVVGDDVLSGGPFVCVDEEELTEIGYFINCGGPQFEDLLGRVWREDSTALPSKHLTSGNVNTADFGGGVLNPPDVLTDPLVAEREYPPEIFPVERWEDGDVSYRFAGLPDGCYEVVLLFMEGCCSTGCLDDGSDPCEALDGEVDPADPLVSSQGCRVFDIVINGQVVADQFSQNVAAACLAGTVPGDPSNRIAVSQQFFVSGTDTIDITIDDLGGGNPPENASIKGLAIRRLTEAEAKAEPGCEVIPVGDAFIRGDADASGEINITDGIFILNFLFTGGDDPICEDAADGDDSGTVNITDGIFVLNFLFTGGDDPPAPWPDCGTDPSDDMTTCAQSHPSCQ